ncbi:receptor-type tyrosine-protein phosphatase alpha-like [Saccostrea echinata]|uniref:receptor-type tyrosine-protein phosphatase alpha-like n=1 Tax=Saccostrea echinata TaxID=191078 RepID=UPI002A83130A|nr:receptor-type tyrosine-protein phosphatase alpha-like [Saccostrea echinata]
MESATSVKDLQESVTKEKEFAQNVSLVFSNLHIVIDAESQSDIAPSAAILKYVTNVNLDTMALGKGTVSSYVYVLGLTPNRKQASSLRSDRLSILRLNVIRKNKIAGAALLQEHEPREEQPLNHVVPQNILRNEANTIFLEEITEADDIVLDEMKSLDVEYTNTLAHRIPVDKFIEYRSIRRENNVFEEEEFAKIPTGLMELYTEAVKKENISKNRYRYVYPYDFCRIVLSTSEEQGRNDYINACYVEGIKGDSTYIAAQGPFTPTTLIDFWRMIWQENSSRIVMLTNLFEGDHMKCLKYWPEAEDKIGDFLIRLESQDVYENYTIRHLVVQQVESEDKNPNEVIKKLTQFHFTSWPDCGVPSDVNSLLCFRDFVKNDRPDADGPIIVHCSAGIGRTGTFIALDYLLEEGSTMKSVDIINCVSKLRQQRAHSIQTKAQYIFLYDALVQGLKNIRR